MFGNDFPPLGESDLHLLQSRSHELEIPASGILPRSDRGQQANATDFVQTHGQSVVCDTSVPANERTRTEAILISGHSYLFLRRHHLRRPFSFAQLSGRSVPLLRTSLTTALCALRISRLLGEVIHPSCSDRHEGIMLSGFKLLLFLRCLSSTSRNRPLWEAGFCLRILYYYLDSDKTDPCLLKETMAKRTEIIMVARKIFIEVLKLAPDPNLVKGLWKITSAFRVFEQFV